MENIRVPSLALPKIGNPVQFLREVKAELKKVDWPSRDKTIRLTVVVVAASILVGAYIGSLDAIFTYLLKFLVE